MKLRLLIITLLSFIVPLQAQSDDAALFAFPASERALAQQAIKAIRDDKPERAISMARTLTDPTIKAVTEWAIYKSPGSPVTAASILSFAKKHPNFPEQVAMLERAEERFLESNPSPNEVIAYFEGNAPRHARALWQLGEAYYAKNNISKAAPLLKQAWQAAALSESDATSLYSAHFSQLTKDDIHTRISHLLWVNQISAAKALLNLATPHYQTLFNARIRLKQESHGVDSAVNQVSETLQSDAGLIYDRIRWRERKGMESAAIELLITIKDTGKGNHSSTWWRLRKRLIRDAIKQQNFDAAYQIASSHNPQSSRIAKAESAWLSGWLASQFLNQPHKAYEYFYHMHQQVSYPISQARASYWAARAAKANGNHDIATMWYDKAKAHSLTFYGQLAMAESDDTASLTLPKAPIITAADRDIFNQSTLVAAIHALIQMEEFDLAQLFIEHAAKQADSPAMQALIGQIGDQQQKTHLSVYAARIAAQQQMPIIKSGYPVFPNYYTIHGTRALTHAITLQESRFESIAASHAGAQGLMQLMPATARRAARTLKENYRRSKLVFDPAFNVRLGSYYINHLKDNFDGHLVLAIAAYNAGQGNVRKWLDIYGDPRDFRSTEEVINWIEMIPFAETRNYVQRVLENKQIYHAIEGNKSLRIQQDLTSHAGS